eukprot:scaffold73024_cov61-Attheya_sp.AAC.1
MFSRPDFSKETLDATPVEFSPGVWLCGESHHPAGIANQVLNNRAFVYKLTLKEDLAGVKKGSECLFVFGLGKAGVIESVKKLELSTGLQVVALLCNGAAHHLQIKSWYLAFPAMAVWVCPTKVPGTLNGQDLMEEFPDRWELVDNTTVPHHAYQLLRYFGSGDELQVDCIVFNQLFFYSDETSRSIGCAGKSGYQDSIKSNGFVFKLVGTLMGDHSCSPHSHFAVPSNHRK